jgi:CMP/dCMP kinase
MIITIDGPSGSGKSTLALKIAKHLHFSYLNSGYLYRGLTYVLKTFYRYDEIKMQNADPNDIQAILTSSNFVYQYAEGLTKVFWNGDITFQLKDPEISRLSAYLAQNSFAREQIHKFEYQFVKDHDTVVEGRACGSVIFPQAEVKFFLTASMQVRALRLQKDQIKRGNLMTLQEAIEHLELRDKMDLNRKVEPLIKPEGAIDLDSSALNPEELLQQALETIKPELKS